MKRMGMRKIQPESSKDLYGPEMIGDSKSAEKKVYYPTANFDQRTLPEAKDWKVGKTYRITMDLKMRGSSTRTGTDEVERGNFDFDITGVDTSAGEQKAKSTRYTG